MAWFSLPAGLRRVVLALCVVHAGPGVMLAQHDQSAIVTVQVKLAPGKKPVVGSGAFISPDGEILTCYHVIEGARTILINTAAGLFGDVVVEEIAPERDIAILRLRGAPKQLGSLKLATQKPSHLLETRLYVYGWLEGAQRQVVDAPATNDQDLSADDLVLPNVRHGGVAGLRIIPLHTTIAPGLSGAPLVSAQGVIGVVLGTVAQHGALSWATPVWQLDRSKMQRIGREPGQVSSWPALATRFGDALNMRAEFPGATMNAEEGYVDALDRARVGLVEWRRALADYTANGTEVIAALGEIPADKMGWRSSQIAHDPSPSELNGHLSALFQRSQKLQGTWDDINGRVLLASTEAEMGLATLKHDAIAAVTEMPDAANRQDLIDSIMDEFVASQKRIQEHPFPRINTPTVTIRDANSVSVGQLRDYIIETQANLREALSLPFQQKIEQYFEAQESAGRPLQRALQLSTR